jgi:hypothetical protein
MASRSPDPSQRGTTTPSPLDYAPNYQAYSRHPRAPGYSIPGRTKDPTAPRLIGPGPLDYAPEAHKEAYMMTSPKVGIGARLKNPGDHIVTPGPLDYSPTLKHMNRAPGFSIPHQERDGHKGKPTPGPQDYVAKPDAYLETKPKYTFPHSGRTIPVHT